MNTSSLAIAANAEEKHSATMTWTSESQKEKKNTDVADTGWTKAMWKKTFLIIVNGRPL